MKNIWPKSWQLIKLQEVASAVSGCAYPIQEYPNDDLYEVITINKITDTSYSLSEARYMKISERELIKFKLRPGDILFCHKNSARQIGKSIVFLSDEIVIHTSRFLRIRVRVSDRYDSRFLEYVLSRYKDAGIITQMANQNDNLLSVTLLQLNNLLIPDLSVAEQKEVLSRIYIDSDDVMTFK
jgi:hypothetical protein